MSTIKLHAIVGCYTPPDEDAPEIECTIYFTFTPGQPERGPTYACALTTEDPTDAG